MRRVAAFGAVVISLQMEGAACTGRLDVGRVGNGDDGGLAAFEGGVDGSVPGSIGHVGSSSGGTSSSGSASSSGSSSSGASSGPSLDSGSSPGCRTAGPGLTSCGPGGSGTENCCTNLVVPGGTFFRTYTNNGTGPYVPGEADPATVSTFRLDKYMVTVGRFRPFVSAWNGGWVPPAGSGKHAHLNGGKGLVNAGDFSGLSYEPGWVASDDAKVSLTNGTLNHTGDSCTWTASATGNENLPMNCVNWYEAYAFCICDGGFLPTSAEYEYAAAGGSQQREYPWGSTDPGFANQYAIYDCLYPSEMAPDGPPLCALGAGNIAPVGTAALGVARWGQLDLAGDIWEWNLDYSSTSGYVDPCMDCAYLQTASYRVLRGGVYSYPPGSLVVSQGGASLTATQGDGGSGFRCARAP